MVKISSDEAFLILQKWHIDLTPVVLVGSLMPSNPLRGTIAEVWNSSVKPGSIWGFLLTSERTRFPVSKFESFEYLQPAELPSNIKMSLPNLVPERGVLALRKRQTVVNTAARGEGDRLVSVEEMLFLVEDNSFPHMQRPVP